MKFKIGDKVMMVRYFNNDNELPLEEMGETYKRYILDKTPMIITAINEHNKYPYNVDEIGEDFKEIELDFYEIDWSKEL